MKFTILTLFPDYFNSPLSVSLLKKAQENSLLEVEIVNIRDYAQEPHKQVDDTPYGGGAGMILKPDVLAEAVRALKTKESKVILPDPGGRKFDQKLASTLSKESNLILIAGRYEGVDQRFKNKYVDLEISLGDFVLNGGEVACLAIIEASARLIPGVIGSSESLDSESFTSQTINGKEVQLLEYPQYTKPVEFEGEKVPDVLLSGNHEQIKVWRQEKSLEKTKKIRPDLLK